MGLAGWPWNRGLFPLELPFFLLGVLSYRMMRLLPASLDGRFARTAAAVAATVLVLLRVGAALTNELWAVDLAGYIVLAIGMPFIFMRTQRSRVDGFLGDLSYPVYLLHILVFAFVAGLASHNPSLTVFGAWVWLAVAAGATAVGSMVLNVLVAVPVDRLRVRFGARKRQVLPPGIELAAQLQDVHPQPAEPSRTYTNRPAQAPADGS
jgi:peptidoglycan/LPS O-acetylase OafA/YrhL